MNRKGFSLIELLAVIVILAIIALIATPIVLNIIDDTKESATLRSAEFYLDALEQSITQLNANNGGNFNPKSCEIEENGNIICDKNKDNVITLKLDGEKPDGGVITIENGKINKVELYYKDKLITKKESKKLEYSPVIYKKVEDSNPGIICGETSKEDLNQATCYIKSIEDLVELSTLVNKGTTFENKKVELVYSLDFNSKRSYAGKEVNETLITGEGFKPIGYSEARSFKGVFEGNNNTIKGLYINRPETSYVGLFGIGVSEIIQNLNLSEFNITGKNSVGSLIGCNSSGKILNVRVSDTYIIGNKGNVGGLTGTSLNEPAKIQNIELQNIKVKNLSNDYVGGLTGTNTGKTIENIKLYHISVKGNSNWVAGLIGTNGKDTTVKNIEGTNIDVYAKSRRGAGLVGHNGGIISKINLSNVNVSGNDYVGGIAGSNEGAISLVKLDNANVIGTSNCTGGLVGVNSGVFDNSIFKGNVNGFYSTGLGVGINSGTIKNIVVEGNIESIRNAVGGLVGSTNATNTGELSIVSGVFRSGNVIGVNPYRSIGLLKSATLNTLASSTITVNGNTVVSDDPTSLNGKSLDNMGKASQSAFEALGFNFDTTSEAYWYFNENDELDLMIK